MQSQTNAKKPRFKVADLAQFVEDDAELAEAISVLRDTLAYAVEKLIAKEGLSADDDKVYDYLVSESDHVTRKCAYDFIEAALEKVQGLAE